VLALHPPAAQLVSLYKRDSARFADALATMKLAPGDPGDERITALVTRYEAELDLRLAAAELGLTGEELAARLERHPGLALGALATGGTIKRDLWAGAFARIAIELGVGVPFTPQSSHDVAPAVWIDRARHTWVAAAGAGDQATAAARCRDRGAELPRTDELQRAIAQGLGAAIHVERSVWAFGVKLDAQNQRFGTVVDTAGLAHRADGAETHAIVCVLR
jgi:hypothetical protein